MYALLYRIFIFYLFWWAIFLVFLLAFGFGLETEKEMLCLYLFPLLVSFLENIAYKIGEEK